MALCLPFSSQASRSIHDTGARRSASLLSGGSSSTGVSLAGLAPLGPSAGIIRFFRMAEKWLDHDSKNSDGTIMQHREDSEEACEQMVHVPFAHLAVGIL